MTRARRRPERSPRYMRMTCNRDCVCVFKTGPLFWPAKERTMTLASDLPRALSRLLPIVAAALLAMVPRLASAADDPIAVVIQDHKFTPSEIRVPAHQRTDLLVKNQDKTAEEFDSDDLHAEKVIPGGHEATVHLPPLAPGRYKFSGEYHSKTAQGIVIAE